MSPAAAAPVSAQGLQSGVSTGSSPAAVLQQGVSPQGEEVAAMESAAEIPCDRLGKEKAQKAV
jgi:hypothetical protein